MASHLLVRATVVGQRHPPVRPLHRMRTAHRRAPPYTVEAAAALAAIAIPLSGRTGWILAAFAWWAAGMIVLVFVDLAVMRLPHRITAVTAAGFLGLLAAGGDPRAWLRAVAAGLVLAGFFAVLAVASRGQLGWGDAALAVPVAAALGWHSWAAVYAGTLLGFGAAAVTAITQRRIGRLAAGAHLPLGPFLIGAAAVVLAVWTWHGLAPSPSVGRRRGRSTTTLQQPGRNRS